MWQGSQNAHLKGKNGHTVYLQVSDSTDVLVQSHRWIRVVDSHLVAVKSERDGGDGHRGLDGYGFSAARSNTLSAAATRLGSCCTRSTNIGGWRRPKRLSGPRCSCLDRGSRDRLRGGNLRHVAEANGGLAGAASSFVDSVSQQSGRRQATSIEYKTMARLRTAPTAKPCKRQTLGQNKVNKAEKLRLPRAAMLAQQQGRIHCKEVPVKQYKGDMVQTVASFMHCAT
jgi:hypothetical protein